MDKAKNILAVVGGVAIISYIGKQIAANILSNIQVSNGVPQLDTSNFYVNTPAGPKPYIFLDLPVTITNNNPFTLGVDYFEGVVKYGDLTLTNVSLPQGVWVGSGETKTINLNVDIPIERVFNDIATLVQQGNIFNALINKLTLSGRIKILGNYSATYFNLSDIAIPII